MIHLSRDILLQIEETERACWTTYLSGVEEIPNNPFGVVISSIGKSTAFLVKSSSSFFFNKTLGFGIEHIDYISDLKDFYHANDKSCAVEIFPLPEHNDLHLALINNGLYLSEFTSMLYKSVEKETEPNFPNITITQIEKEQSDILADIHVDGFGFQGEEANQEYEIVKAGYNNEMFKCYVASINNEPVAAGTLFIYDEVGVLFGGATRPQSRGKSCQKALIYYRINEARENGCKYLISHTNMYSTSQRNLEKIGFRLACNLARWIDYPL